MKRLLYTLLGFVLYVALIVGLAFLLHLEGTKRLLFILILILLGAIACAVILWYLKKIDPTTPPADATDLGNLDALLRDADAKLKQANRGAKSLAAMPLIYVIGDENSAKSQTILQSGLDPELLAGQVYRDQAIVPTAAANIWLTGQAAVVEAGGALLRQPALWQRLVKLTAPGKLGTALSKSALQPTRAVVLCVSLERILAPSTTEQIRALAQTMNERLRQLSQTLGIALPVYVLFTKLDTVPAFADYAANLSADEVRTPVGSLLARLDTGAGLYAEQAATQIGSRFDEVLYLLSEFRLELLARGGEAPLLARSYEFPRDLRKLRPGIVDLLVEVARPSQIGVNPYLRGFFFSGMRAHIVEDVLSVGARTAAPTPSFDAGATRAFSFAAMQQAATPEPLRRSNTRKVPQWTFLPYFFSHLVLADKTALDSSRSSTKVSGVKRVLAACVCALLALYLVLLTISFFNNRALEQRAAANTSAVPMISGKDAVANVSDLQTLDQLRLLLVQLDGYHRDGAPLSYRWGLYHGDQLRASVCRAYGTRFNRLLLVQTQGNITAKLAALPVKAAPTDEYQATYKPLKAWLITTSNPDKSSDFLPPVLEHEWIAARTNIPDETKQLAQNQFDYYAVALPPTDAQPSCLTALNGAKPDATLLANTRGYLNSFAGIDHVYLSMKAAADRHFPPIEFKKLYPASVGTVTAPTIVDGAFSKDGFTFMEDAIKHPDQYLSGEEWVTGPSTQTVDRSALAAQLQTRYQTDFLSAWRTYLKTARVNDFGALPDAANRLHTLDGPASPLLAILSVAAKNTAVADASFSQPFQAPQSVTPPAGPPVNTGYTEKLAGIEQAIRQMLSTPATANDPTGVNAAVAPADAAVSGLRGGFQPPDPAGIADTATERLLREPIQYAAGLAIKAPAAGAKKAGEEFCAKANTILGKFPFNPDSKEDADPTAAATFFGPAGPIAAFATEQAKLIAFNGTLYTAVNPGTVNPALLTFLNATHAVGTTLFPSPGATQPTLTFSIAQQATPNLTPSTLEIDGATFANVGVPNRVVWSYKPQGSVKLAGSGQTKNNFGPWSIFHFTYAAKHPAPNQLEYIFQNNGITEKAPNGTEIIYRFAIEDAGARLLNPAFMKTQLRCVSKVAQ